MAHYDIKYNPSLVPQTNATQKGNVEISYPGPVDYTQGGWYGGYDDTNSYIVLSDTDSTSLVGRSTAGGEGTAVSGAATFWKVNNTNPAVLSLINRLPGSPGNFANAADAKAWIDSNSAYGVVEGEPAPPIKSLSFNGTQGTQLDVLGTTTDWALGKNGTIEWWQKTAPSNTFPGGGFNGGIISQGSGAGSNHGIDLFQAGGINTQLGGNTAAWPDPPGNVWSHIAVTLVPSAGGGGANAHVYINGVEQNLIAGYSDSNLTNGSEILRIGCRIPNVNYQNWTGLITNLHINTQTLYSGTFTPAIRTLPIAGTVLLLAATNPLIDIGPSSHTTTGNVAVVADGPEI
jgi:hypothetical protein